MCWCVYARLWSAIIIIRSIWSCTFVLLAYVDDVEMLPKWVAHKQQTKCLGIHLLMLYYDDGGDDRICDHLLWRHREHSHLIESFTADFQILCARHGRPADFQTYLESTRFFLEIRSFKFTQLIRAQTQRFWTILFSRNLLKRWQAATTTTATTREQKQHFEDRSP